MKITIQTILKSLIYLGFTAIGFIFLIQVNKLIHNTAQSFILQLFMLTSILFISMRYKILRLISIDEMTWKQVYLNGLFLGITGGLIYFTLFNFFSI